MEVSDVTSFLSSITPFNHLDDSAILQLSQHISVYYFQAQEIVPLNNTRLFIARTGLFNVYDAQQQLITKLQSADFYGYQALLTKLNDNNVVVCEEDGLVYWLKADAFHQCRFKNEQVELFFQRLFSRRLHQYHEQNANTRFTLKISDITKERKITLSPTHNVQDAAKLMSSERVSSLLIEDNRQLVGIITDRDLRNRVLAHALNADTLISTIMTPSPHTIDYNAYVYEAVQKMSQFNIHHLPVLLDNQCVGMLTATDLVRHEQDHPVYLIGEIHRQMTVEGLTNVSKHIRNLAKTLHKQQVPAYEASHIITTITDALTQRLIFLAKQHLGDAPCVYTWLSFGSQARKDQSLNADQDNALILEKEPTGIIAAYFSAFADFVCQGLASCGIMLCPGNIMASNAELRLTLKGWSSRFERLINTPTPDALLKASIYFDVRAIDGSKALFNALQEDILLRTKNAPLFLYHLAKNSLNRTAPLGLFKHFILEHDGHHNKGLDLKKRGISLITDLVRVYALAEGISEVNTRQRLDALKQKGSLDKKQCQNLQDAFEILSRLRWEKHQSDLLAEHEISNLLDPSKISSLARHQLKDSFAVISDAQARLKHRFCRD